MRVIGWCTRCHKVRQVTVRPSGIMGVDVVVGVCGECEEGMTDSRQVLYLMQGRERPAGGWGDT